MGKQCEGAAPVEGGACFSPGERGATIGAHYRQTV
jgi:hypothetical protein